MGAARLEKPSDVTTRCREVSCGLDLIAELEGRRLVFGDGDEVLLTGLWFAQSTP